MKIHPVGAEFYVPRGQTDMTKLIVALSNFANAPKNHKQICANGGIIRTLDDLWSKLCLVQIVSHTNPDSHNFPW